MQLATSEKNGCMHAARDSCCRFESVYKSRMKYIDKRCSPYAVHHTSFRIQPLMFVRAFTTDVNALPNQRLPLCRTCLFCTFEIGPCLGLRTVCLQQIRSPAFVRLFCQIIGL